MYKLYKDPMSENIYNVIRTSDGAYIPMSEANTDYQEYLKWVAEGNQPLPSDEQT